MTTKIAILKVLSSYPDGQASLDALKADLTMLWTREWLARMRAMRALAGQISLFGDKLVTRDAKGWKITKAGRDLLERIEHRAQLLADKPELTVISSSEVPMKSDFQHPPRLALIRLAAG
jgi:hypothetical protein